MIEFTRGIPTHPKRNKAKQNKTIIERKRKNLSTPFLERKQNDLITPFFNQQSNCPMIVQRRWNIKLLLPPTVYVGYV